MQFPKNPNRPCEQTGARPSRQSWRLNWGRIAVCLAAMAALAGAAQSGQQISPRGPDQAGPGSIYPPILTDPPDANAQMRMRELQAKQQDYAAANAERKKQIADDSARLLKLATDLKAEVDKTTKDTLSLSVIRKADEIERLAHNVKEKMKLTVGGS